MNDYVNYIDSLEPSAELISGLKNLKAPKKRVPVYRVASLAAALILAVGIGVGVRAISTRDESPHNELGEPDIISDPGEDDIPTPSYGGGYDIVENGAVAHYTYPRLDFADASGLPAVEPDYTLGEENEYTRSVTAEDVEHIFGKFWRERLGLGDEWVLYDSYGSGLFFNSPDEANGLSFHLACDEGSTYFVELLRGYDVPSCYVLPDDFYGHTDVDGVAVQSLEYATDRRCEVSFFAGGFGYRVRICDADNYRELAARFVGLALDERRGLEDVRHEYNTPSTPTTPEKSITQSYAPTK